MSTKRMILIRHGESNISLPKQKCTAKEFGDWVNQYNTASIRHDTFPASKLIELMEPSTCIMTSGLVRAIESAKQINNNNQQVNDVVFDEAQLPEFELAQIKLKPVIWSIVLRLLWFLGVSQGCESVKEFRKRAILAVNHLESIADEKQNVLLVGHGILNRFIARRLVKTGWEKVEQHRFSQCWGFVVFEKL